jgi:hypothetical protein
LPCGDVSLRFRYAGRDCEECPNNRLRSDSLNPVDRPDVLVLESVHPDIGDIVHHRGQET